MSKASLLRFLTFISIVVLGIQSWSQSQKNVLLLDHWDDTNITLTIEEARYSDLWGFSQNGQNYCAVGSSEGVEILRVEESRLTFVDREPGAFQGVTVVHRDYKTYENYLYAVGDEGTATLQIFDLSYLPDSISKVYDSNTLFGICHNLFIDTIRAKLYACGTNGTGMKVYDLNDPVNPILTHDFNDVGYVHDAFVRNDTAFLNCGYDGVRVYDFSGPTPILLGLLDFYPDQGYNHSGWLSNDGSRYVFADETQGTKLKVCNIDDLANIQVNQTFATANYQDYVPHNEIILNNLIFVAYYNEGLRVFDASKSPIDEIAHYDTFTDETAYKLNGAWGIYVFEQTNQILVSDRQNGIFLFEFPIHLLDRQNSGTIISNIPFVDENSYIIPRDYLDEASLTFSIFDLKGSLVYHQENYLNWINVPLNLNAGVYYYGIYNQNNELLESGKFAVGN